MQWCHMPFDKMRSIPLYRVQISSIFFLFRWINHLIVVKPIQVHRWSHLIRLPDFDVFREWFCSNRILYKTIDFTSSKYWNDIMTFSLRNMCDIVEMYKIRKTNTNDGINIVGECETYKKPYYLGHKYSYAVSITSLLNRIGFR